MKQFENQLRASQRHPNLSQRLLTVGCCELGCSKKSIEQHADLEYTDVVANSLLLVLCYALGNPGDVPDFLFPQFHPCINNSI